MIFCASTEARIHSTYIGWQKRSPQRVRTLFRKILNSLIAAWLAE